MSDHEFDLELAELRAIIKMHVKEAWSESRDNGTSFPLFTIMLIKHGIDSMALASDGEWDQQSVDKVLSVITKYYKKTFKKAKAMNEPQHKTSKVSHTPLSPNLRVIHNSLKAGE